MQLSAPFAALATIVLSAVVLAAPQPIKLSNKLLPVIKKSDFSFMKRGTNEVDFAKVASHLNQIKSKYAQGFQNYQQNTDKTFFTRAEKRGTGTDSLTDVGGYEWAVPMTWGGQDISFDLDTGSSDVIVNKDAYSPGSSSEDTGKSSNVGYADGTSTTCENYIDDLNIAGLGARAAICHADNDFMSGQDPSVGVAGMAYPSISSTGQTPFFDALHSAGALDSFVFTVKLASQDATLYLGGVDPASDPVYTDVTDQGFWQVDSTLGGVENQGFIDSGTSLIVAQPDTAKSIFDSLGLSSYSDGSTTYGEYDCNNPPTITFTFGDFSQAMSNSTMYMGTHDGNCVLSILGHDYGYSQIIYGVPLMQNVYVTFDRDNNRVGFSSQ